MASSDRLFLRFFLRARGALTAGERGDMARRIIRTQRWFR